MNEIANKLYELRKRDGYSQEELADKLAVSRQAISKWERGEALPDTSNLIALARLYRVSLDELVCLVAQPSAEKAEQSEISAEIGKESNDGEEECEEEECEDEEGKTLPLALNLLKNIPSPVVITVAFLLWGFLADGWAVAWTLYLLVPVISSIFDCFYRKRVQQFCYPLLVVFLYCFLGMLEGIWHPTWIIFLTIPLFYGVADAIDKSRK